MTWQSTYNLHTKIRQQYRSEQFAGKDNPKDPAYTLWHAYADYQVTPNWSVNAGIENIGNKHLLREDSSSLSFSDLGRRYFVGINASF